MAAAARPHNTRDARHAKESSSNDYPPTQRKSKSAWLNLTQIPSRACSLPSFSSQSKLRAIKDGATDDEGDRPRADTFHRRVLPISALLKFADTWTSRDEALLKF